jgi:hypothetical protein
MKRNTVLILASFLAVTALARLMAPFSSWDRVKESSSSIVIVKCGDPIPPAPGVIVMNATKSDSAICVRCVLKGTGSLGPARLLTDYDLRNGENYLVFGYLNGTNFIAFEDYRVIPLGINFSTNLIDGKPLNEQIEVLFKRRLELLNRQMAKEQEEKRRLELVVTNSNN